MRGRIRPGRPAGYQHPAGDMRIASGDFAHDRESRVVLVICREKNFVSGIILAKKALYVFLETRLDAMNRLEYGDRGE